MTNTVNSYEQAIALHMFDLMMKKREIENRIEQIKQNYINTWDDDEAEQMRVDWHYLKEEKRLIEWCLDNIKDYCKQVNQ